MAVFTHEMFELQTIRALLQRGGLTLEDFGRHTAPLRDGNLHDQARDLADAAVLKMRGAMQ